MSEPEKRTTRKTRGRPARSPAIQSEPKVLKLEPEKIDSSQNTTKTTSDIPQRENNNPNPSDTNMGEEPTPSTSYLKECFKVPISNRFDVLQQRTNPKPHKNAESKETPEINSETESDPQPPNKPAKSKPPPPIVSDSDQVTAPSCRRPESSTRLKMNLQSTN
ncbi:serine-rich 25 kDa antigen protein-like [Chrysoperla carnea]|uniref:serine-rich 25 kDa antigen protein-like n=1 Tax=Chrysoperla carnea TaxID=189513 RepID=UPI001D0987B6|nr:serine-rich 25 kDa antigen protein-like [Chrysoperla carnea]